MNGFKVTCLSCGKETEFKEEFDTDNDTISVYPSGYDGEIKISCDCGNEIQNAF